MGVVIPVMVPIMLPKPRLISMKKNMTDQKGLAGKWVMASVKAMKASPVPCTAWRREEQSPSGYVQKSMWLLYLTGYSWHGQKNEQTGKSLFRKRPPRDTVSYKLCNFISFNNRVT